MDILVAIKILKIIIYMIIPFINYVMNHVKHVQGKGIIQTIIVINAKKIMKKKMILVMIIIVIKNAHSIIILMLIKNIIALKIRVVQVIIIN